MKDEKMTRYFHQAKADCLAQAKALTADCREDEARLEKIRANVFDIFATVYQMTQTMAPAEGEAFFLAKLSAIPAAWQEALAAARAHDDRERRLIEEIKLAAVKDIETQYRGRGGAAS